MLSIFAAFAIIAVDDKIAANEAKDCKVREEPRVQDTC